MLIAHDVSLWLPLMHWRAAALTFAIGGHHPIDVSVAMAEPRALPSGACLSAAHARLDHVKVRPRNDAEILQPAPSRRQQKRQQELSRRSGAGSGPI